MYFHDISFLPTKIDLSLRVQCRKGECLACPVACLKKAVDD